jgi:hypothetical protein
MRFLSSVEVDEMATNFDGARILQDVREGMKVSDANGEEVGTVNFVHFADPEAVTTEADRRSEEGGGVGTGSGPDLTPLDVFEGDADSGATERQRQTGYIRIDAKGWFSGDKYVGAEHVTEVNGNDVTLSVTKDSL